MTSIDCSVSLKLFGSSHRVPTAISCGDVNLPGNYGPCSASELHFLFISAHSDGIRV